MKMATVNFCICILLAMVTISLGQRRTEYDVSRELELPTRPPLHVAETVSVRLRTECLLHCQQRPWCQYFALCSTLSSTKMCHLFKGNVTSPATNFTTPGCTVYKEVSTTPAVCDDATATTASTSQSSEEQTTHAQGTADETVTSTTTTQKPMVSPTTPAPNTDMSTGCGSSTDPTCSGIYLDCKHTAGHSDTVVYTIYTFETDGSGGDPVQVPCYKGKILIQRRTLACPEGFFNRSWSEYESGFGNLSGDCFWLGNAKVWRITRQSIFVYSLFINLGLSENNQMATYPGFALGSAESKYKLQYEAFETDDGTSNADGFGAPGYSSSFDLNGRDFFTSDRDSQNSCASRTGSGWWFNVDCAIGNLNHEDGPKWPDDNGIQLNYEWSEMGLVGSNIGK